MTHADIARRFGEERFGVRLNAAKRAGETTVEDEDRTLDMFALGLDYQGDNFRLSGDIGHQYHFIDNPRPSVRLNGGVPSAPDARTTSRSLGLTRRSRPSEPSAASTTSPIP